MNLYHIVRFVQLSPILLIMTTATPSCYSGQRDTSATAQGKGTISHSPATRQTKRSVRIAPAIQVSESRSDMPHVEPNLVILPGHPEQLIVTSMVYPSSGYAQPALYRSNNKGKSWTSAQLPEKVHSAIDPWLEFDHNGIVYFVHLPGVLYRSQDAGSTWSPPIRLPNASHSPLDFPKIVADRNPKSSFYGYVYVISGGSARTPTGQSVGPIFLFRSQDSGLTFNSPRQLLPAYLNYQVSSPPLILSNGSILVGFYEIDHFGNLLPPHRIWTARSFDAGTTFGPAQLVAADGGGNLTMAMDKSLGHYHDRVYITFLRKADSNIYLVFSDDQGMSWSEPRMVNDSPLEANSAPATPMLSVNNSGILGIFWADHRVSRGQKCYQTWFSFSVDGGASLSKNVLVSGASCPDVPGNNLITLDDTNIRMVDRFSVGGDYYGFAAAADGCFHAVWVDSRSGLFQLWTTSIEVGNGKE